MLLFLLTFKREEITAALIEEGEAIERPIDEDVEDLGNVDEGKAKLQETIEQST